MGKKAKKEKEKKEKKEKDSKKKDSKKKDSKKKKKKKKHKKGKKESDSEDRTISVWDALDVPLQEPKWKGKGTKSNTDSQRLPATPLKVFGIFHDVFVDIFQDKVDLLRGIQLNENSYTPFTSVTEPQMLIPASSETNTATYVKVDYAAILRFFIQNNLKEYWDFEVSDDTKEASCRCDFAIAAPDGRLVYPGEVKPASYCSGIRNLAKHYNENESRPTDNGRWVSPVRQAYNYSLSSGKQGGIIATHEMFWPFFRDCRGNMCIVSGFHWSDYELDEGCSVVQALCLFTLVMSDELAYRIPGLYGCGTTDCTHDLYGTIVDSSQVLGVPAPEGPQVITFGHRQRARARFRQGTAKRHKSRHSRVMSDFYASNRSTRVRKFLGEGASGLVQRFTFGEGGKRRSFVGKSGCVVKNEELEQEFEKEAKIYEVMQELQGEFVPKLFGYGYDPVQTNLYTLSLSEEGTSVAELEGITQEEKERGLVALDNIHSLGVLHGDIRLPNVLVNRAKTPCRVMMTDFGRSELVDATDETNQARMKGERDDLEKLLDAKVQQL